jgi:hypothetical protein
MSAKYRVHRYDLGMTAYKSKLEQFLNSLERNISTITGLSLSCGL